MLMVRNEALMVDVLLEPFQSLITWKQITFNDAYNASENLQLISWHQQGFDKIQSSLRLTTNAEALCEIVRV